MLRVLRSLCRTLPLVAVVAGLTGTTANGGITGSLLITNNVPTFNVKVFINGKEVGIVESNNSAKFAVNDAADARTIMEVRKADGVTANGQSWEDTITTPNRDNGDHLWVINPKQSDVEEEGAATEEAVDATTFNAPKAAAAVAGDPNAPRTAGALIMPAGGGYRSDSLGGEFHGQQMYVNLNGTRALFWGARALSLDPDSPLHDLRIRLRNGAVVQFGVGDVLSRLDGVYLNNNKSLQGNVWQMPELDRHFGDTEVRWIKQGTHNVFIGQIFLDNSRPFNGGGGNNSGGGPAPVTP